MTDQLLHHRTMRAVARQAGISPEQLMYLVEKNYYQILVPLPPELRVLHGNAAAMGRVGGKRSWLGRSLCYEALEIVDRSGNLVKVAAFAGNCDFSGVLVKIPA